MATTAIVVFAPGDGAVACGCERSNFRASASPFPSGVLTPATTAPVVGSMMSPTAFTATSAATTRPFGNVIAKLPTPAFMARSRLPNILPMVESRACSDVSFHHRTIRCGRSGAVAAVRIGTDVRASAESEVHQYRPRNDRHDSASDLEANLLFFEVSGDAVADADTVGAAAGQKYRIHLLDGVERIEKIGIARTGCAASLRIPDRSSPSPTQRAEVGVRSACVADLMPSNHEALFVNRTGPREHENHHAAVARSDQTATVHASAGVSSRPPRRPFMIRGMQRRCRFTAVTYPQRGRGDHGPTNS